MTTLRSQLAALSEKFAEEILGATQGAPLHEIVGGGSVGNAENRAKWLPGLACPIPSPCGDGRVAWPFGFALTDPSMRLSRTRLLSKVTRVISEPPGRG